MGGALPDRTACERRSRRGRAGAMLLTLAAPFVLLTAGFAVFVNNAPTRPPALPDKADAIIALTGDGYRLHEAGRLLIRGHAGQLLISGVHDKVPDRRIRQISGLSANLFACCVTIDRKAMDTRGNAAYGAQWAVKHKFGRIIIVTSDYHMRRAMLEFDRMLPDRELITWPVRSGKAAHSAGSAGWLRLWGHEYVKYLLALTTMGLLANPE